MIWPQSPVAEPEYVDTNVLVRLLMDDDPVQSPAARAYFRAAASGKARPFISASTISELVYVLGGPRLRFERARLAEAVEAVLDLDAVVSDRSVVARACALLRTAHPDWDDCLLAAYAIERAEGRLVSFDRGLDRIPGLRREAPAQ